jgi:hypothetical protein
MWRIIMASRLFNNACKTLENEVVVLYAILTMGGSGAVTLTRGKGITSAAKSATGTYLLTLDNVYARLLGCLVTPIRSTATDLTGQVLSETVASTGTITLGIVNHETPALTQPTSGDIFHVEITLGNSD